VSVLVDTSVWVSHFKQRNERLVSLLESGLVRCHPYVVVEIACGTPPNRHNVIGLLQALEMVSVATPLEMIELLARRQLYGRGCGFVDMSLLAGALLCGGTQLWTLDKRLAVLAHEVGVAYELGLH
jgi:predicted nucleic acid-binding protein